MSHSKLKDPLKDPFRKLTITKVRDVHLKSRALGWGTYYSPAFPPTRTTWITTTAPLLPPLLPALLPPPKPDAASRRKKPLKEIFMKDMDRKKTATYEDRFLEVTIIDDPYFFLGNANCVIEDKDKSVCHMAVADLPVDKKALKALGCGSVIRIEDPVHVYSKDDYDEGGEFPSLSHFWVEDPKKLISVRKKIDMCRYCGEEYATKKCSLCKRHYCGKECQVKDWIDLKHKYICKLPY